MSSRPESSHPSAGRRGLTLVEVMVALVLLGIAITLLGSTMARSVTVVADSRLDLAAAAQLNRLEILRAAVVDSCPGPSAGATPAVGLTERWTTVRIGGALEVADSVVRSNGALVRLVSTRLSCP